MKKTNLVVKIALGLIVFGFIFASIGALMGGKFTILKDEIEYRVYDKDNRITDSSSLEKFKNINLDVNLDKIEIVKSNENKIELDYSDKIGSITYKVEDNTLTINQNKNASIGIDVNLGFNKYSDTIKIYVKYDNKLNDIVAIQNYGDISLNDINCKNASIESSYGNVTLSNISSDKLTVTMEDGNINLNNVNVSDSFNLQNKYGSVDLDNCEFNTFVAYLEDGNLDISKINTNYSEIKNKYGNIYAVDFSTNGLLANADDGDMDFRGSFLGTSNLNNKYGNINIVSNQNKNSYNYSIVNKYGNVDIDNEIFEGSVMKSNNANNNLDINCDDGNVKISFSK